MKIFLSGVVLFCVLASISCQFPVPTQDQILCAGRNLVSLGASKTLDCANKLRIVILRVKLAEK